MSRLIFRGNTVKNFGEFLPVPHIERIYVYDEKITVELSFMLTLVEGQDEDELLERLSGLQTYLFLTNEADYQVQGEAKIINKSTDATRSLFTVIAAVGAMADFTNSDYATVLFSEFESIGEYLYDTSGNKILKLITTVDTTSAEDHEAGTFGELILDAIADGDETELTLYAFSSMLEIMDGALMRYDAGGPTLADQNISDVAYEIIFEDGELLGQPEIIWVTTSKTAGVAPVPFDGIPVQALGSAKYYTQDQITLKEITESFNELVDEYSTQAETDTVLESVVDSISYVLAVYGTEPNLLPRLDILRKAWPDKSRATFTGKLYKKFKGKLHKANIGVSNGILLHKELVLNPKIIDVREPPLEDYYAGEIQELEDDEYIYTGADKSGFFVDLQNIVSTAADALPDEYGGEYISDYTKASGFFFFDYEKFMHSGSNIMTVFNPIKIDEHYGKGLLNSYLTVDKVTLKRYDTLDSIKAFMKMYMPTYADSGSTDRIPEETVLYTYHDLEAYVETSDGDEEWSYLNFRNFDFAAGEKLAQSGDTWDYRLMMFEFQDLRAKPYSYADLTTFFETGTGPTDFYFGVTVETTDNTLNIVKALTSSYYSYYTGSLQDYYDLATEYCSYNEVDGKFNKFFTDAVMAAYADNMEEAPWIRLPVVYNIHSDLLFNTFGGDTAELINASKKMTDHIDPYQGNIERIDNFKNKFESLYDNYYASGDIPTMMEENDKTSKHFSITFDEFPVVWDSTYEAQAAAYVALEEALDALNDILDEYTEAGSDSITYLSQYLGQIGTVALNINDAGSVDALEDLASDLSVSLQAVFQGIEYLAQRYHEGPSKDMIAQIAGVDVAEATDTFSILDDQLYVLQDLAIQAGVWRGIAAATEWDQGNAANITTDGVTESESAWAWYTDIGNDDGDYYAHAENSGITLFNLISHDGSWGEWYTESNDLINEVISEWNNTLAIIATLIEEVEATGEAFGF